MIFLGFAPGAAMLRAAVAIFCCMFIFSERKLRHMTAGLRLGEPVSVRVALFVMARTFSNILQRPLPTLRPRLTTALSFVLATTAAAAQAGRPMVVDDAGIVAAKSCQVESWIKNNHGSTEYWAVPGCNFSGNLEVAFGGARITGAQGATSSAALQAKTLLKPLDTNGWGVALAVGNQFKPEHGIAGDLYANVPVSFSFRDDRLIVHANLGWLHEKEAARHALTWGLGAEAQLTPRTTLTSEVFGQHRGKPFFQLGVKHWLLVDRLQIDATYGDRFGRQGAERTISIGLVLFTSAILP